MYTHFDMLMEKLWIQSANDKESDTVIRTSATDKSMTIRCTGYFPFDIIRVFSRVVK